MQQNSSSEVRSEIGSLPDDVTSAVDDAHKVVSSDRPHAVDDVGEKNEDNLTHINNGNSRVENRLSSSVGETSKPFRHSDSNDVILTGSDTNKTEIIDKRRLNDDKNIGIPTTTKDVRINRPSTLHSRYYFFIIIRVLWIVHELMTL